MDTNCINLELLRQTAVTSQPFPYLIVPNFIRTEALEAIHQDYPETAHPGSFPLQILNYGAAFANLINELESDNLRNIIAEKFSMDLNSFPTLITVRGYADLRDGSIHRDTKSKQITVLLYMNASWENQGGRLRLLHDSQNLDNIITEIPPTAGTLLIFKVSPNSWHGHKPFAGPRRVVQLNYVADQNVVDKEIARHRLSARFKSLKRLIGL